MAELAKAYRSADAGEPSPALDANVLAAARRHLAQKHAIRSTQKRPSLWRWLSLPAGAALACGVLAISIWHSDAPQTGFVQPASIPDQVTTQDRPAMELPTSEPLRAPPAVRAGDVCAIRESATPAAAERELKRLDAGGCAASVAQLRQSMNTERAP